MNIEKNTTYRTKQKQTAAYFRIVIYLIFAVMMGIVLLNKDNYFVDEIYSYGLANHQDGIALFENEKKYIPADVCYMNYMTVNQQHRFDYPNVWINQKKDVHPPLYYVLLHTICSFFPERFSIWFAGVINIVFALMTLKRIRSLSSILSGHRQIITEMVTIIFVCSAGILSSISFLRMYVMAMYWITRTADLVLKEMASDEYNNRFFIDMFFTATAGALTHYYCIIFTVSISLFACIYLLLKKRYKAILCYCLTGAVSAISAYLIFPPMITHMFLEKRGSESIQNLQGSISEFCDRIQQFIQIIDKDLFGGIGIILIAYLAILLLIAVIRKKGTKETQQKECLLFKQYLLLCFAITLYFLFVGKSAVYISTRYMFPIYGLLLTVVMEAVLILNDIIWKDNIGKGINILLIVCYLAGSWHFQQWKYLYKQSNVLLEKASQYSDVDCLFLYDKAYQTYPSFLETGNYRSLTYLKIKDLDHLKKLQLINEDRLIIINVGGDDILDQITKEYHYTVIEEIGSHGYGTSYYLTSEKE